MKRLHPSFALAPILLGMAACQPAAVAPIAPRALDDLSGTMDWKVEKGADLQAKWDKGVKQILLGQPRDKAIEAIKASGYECTFGEAHEKYPDPAAQCTRSFGTPECQMDWEIFSTADKGKVDSVDASFKRDCIGTDNDYPEPKKSALDDNLAPPNLPPATPGSKPN